MAKRKRLSAAIDLGSSLIKIVGVDDGAMSAVVMSPESIDIILIIFLKWLLLLKLRWV